MRHESGTTTVSETIADVQFAGRQTGKIDWRSRPAAALVKRTAAPSAASAGRR
jgi:hypothetical protein